VAASLLTAACRMLKTGTFCQDLGAHDFDNRSEEKHLQRLVQRIQNL
jgi:hypothetical protein